jgi:hypothetical protein
MANGATTSILIRVQAKGGKFLANDIGAAEVTIRDAQTGVWLGGGLALGSSSGDLAASYAPNASLSTIVTPATEPNAVPQVQWLVADASTSGLAIDLPITRPTLLEITAFGPLGGLQSAHRATLTQWIAPGQTIDQGPGFVVEIPGLLVQVMQPQTHLTIPSTSLPCTVPLEASVAMMCGCPIADGEPWIPADFLVTAAIGPVGQPAADTVVLVYTGNTSLFAGSYQVTAAADYQAVITAVQTSTGNTGIGTVTFFVKSAS